MPDANRRNGDKIICEYVLVCLILVSVQIRYAIVLVTIPLVSALAIPANSNVSLRLDSDEIPAHMKRLRR